MHINKRLPYIALIFAILLVEFLYVLKGIRNDCFHATDFSIYQQAIYDIDFFSNMNPYLTIRNIKIFNDHFDPIVYLASLVTFVFGKNIYTLVSFEFFWIIISFIFIYKTAPTTSLNKLKFLLLMALTKGIFTATQFPIHPSTWSLFPILLLFYKLSEKKYVSFFLTLIFLFLFREVFPFATLVLGLYLFAKNKERYGVYTFLISLLWILIVYKLRPYLLGPIYNYGSITIGSIFTNPMALIKKLDIIVGLKIYLPFFISYLLLTRIRKSKEEIKSISIYALVFAAPLIGLHFITNKMHFQYGIFLTAPLIAGLYLNKDFYSILENKKKFLIILSFFFLTASGTHTKALKGVFANVISKCSLEENATQSRKEVRKRIRQIDFTNNTLLATGGAIPAILDKGNKVYQLGIFSKKLSSYDYIYLSKNKAGDTFPYKVHEINQIIKRCKFDRIIYESNFYFFAQGLSEVSCLEQSY